MNFNIFLLNNSESQIIQLIKELNNQTNETEMIT